MLNVIQKALLTASDTSLCSVSNTKRIRDNQAGYNTVHAFVKQQKFPKKLCDFKKLQALEKDKPLRVRSVYFECEKATSQKELFNMLDKIITII